MSEAPQRSLAVPKLSEEDLHTFGCSTGEIHNLAVELGLKLKTLPEQELIQEGHAALAELKNREMLSAEEATSIAILIELGSHTAIVTDETETAVKNTYHAVVNGHRPSPVAVMLCSIAVKSVELQKQHQPVGRVLGRGFGAWCGDVAGGAIGGLAGGLAGGFLGSLAAGLTVAAIVSGAILA